MSYSLELTPVMFVRTSKNMFVRMSYVCYGSVIDTWVLSALNCAELCPVHVRVNPFLR